MLYWCPGHEEIEGYCKVDELAKEATVNNNIDNQNIIPSSLSKLQQNAKHITPILSPLTEEEKKRVKFKTGRIKIAESLGTLEKGIAALIHQLREGHVPLNAYSIRIKSIQNNKFPKCDTNNQAKFLSKFNENNPKVLYNSITLYYQSNQSKNQARVFLDEIAIKSESAYKIKHFCQNGTHNPITKHSANQCRQLHPELKKQTRDKNNKRNANQQNHNRAKHTSQKPPFIFEEDDSSSNDTQVVNYSKAYAAKSNQYPTSSYLDTAPSSHMIGHWKFFQTYKKKFMSVETADGSHTLVLDHGLVEFKLNDSKVKLHCIHVPEIKETLISMGRLWDSGFSMIRRNHNHFDVKNNKEVLMNGKVCNNMFELNLEIVPPKQSELACVLISGEKLHNHAGHPGIEVLKMMFPQVSSVPFCDACALSKSHRQPYKGKLPRAPYVGHTIHSDLSRRRISPPSIDGANYYLKLTDDYSRFKTVYIIKNKLETFDAIKDYLNEVEQKHGTKVKILVNDNGGEYLSRQLQNLLEENDIKMVLTTPYSPQQNPISERGNQTTSEKA
ncbi:hypothetical protein O181_049778 [Austropuccinia psidii MF-1]|uniref:Integrase catalytic domain-containing protein n=1 Tax=Austropuccinia psidii MF-1 TaxID=1389203 RepID=A0A9Q3DY52_9BASI|nr:hypothetical protein [Austropuccinia psidii MF-1]